MAGVKGDDRLYGEWQALRQWRALEEMTGSRRRAGSRGDGGLWGDWQAVEQWRALEGMTGSRRRAGSRGMACSRMMAGSIGEGELQWDTAGSRSDGGL